MGDSKTAEPMRFEHYRVLTDAEGRPVKLGEGAMGVTYLAEDTNLRVKVALKVIAPSLLGDVEIAQRFQREAQAAARLRHPNVAAVYHLGTVDNTFFYTMEFVEGETLREHVIRNGPLSVKQALEVTLQVCEALGAAERHHMVHRDIKPANIMLETSEDGLHAKLIDFGLAKPLQHDAQQTSALLTQRGTFLGTAVFASPEQVQDFPLDTRSDFYALGLTLWVMLEGRPPFEGSLHKVLYDQVHTKPPLDRLLWVPAEVRELLGKLLEKQPDARPQSARELRQMIHDCQRSLASANTGYAEWQQRFQVSQAPRVQPWGNTYEGQDTLSGAVWLHLLRNDRFNDEDVVKRVVADVRRAIDIHHPNVLRHITVFPTSDAQGAGWMVVTEHPGSQTLLAHLRKVKQLPSAEALPLLERLAEALDCCLASDFPAADLDPARIYLKPHATAPGEVTPKLCPINYSFLATLRQGDETAIGVTQVMSRGEPRNAQEAVQRLATLAYQCLGGAWGRMTRYIPLPGLTQRQNDTLRLAITEKSYDCALDFVSELQQTKTPRRSAATPPSAAEATVTLGAWEKLAAIAAPEAAIDPSAPTQTFAPAIEPETSRVESRPPTELPAPEPTQPIVPSTTGEPLEPEPVAEEIPITDTPEEEPVIATDDEAVSVETPLDEPASPAIADEPEAGVPATVPPKSGTTSTFKTTATELPLVGQRGQDPKTSSITAIRETLENEWRDAKPIFDKIATPVRESVTKLPRWAFITIGTFVLIFAAVLWAIANRPMPTITPQDPDPVKPLLVAKPDIGNTKPALPVPPPLPSLSELLQTATEAAGRGDKTVLLDAWKDMQKRFPEPKWNSAATSSAFIASVAVAYRDNKLGNPAQTARDYLPVLAAAAKESDIPLLLKLSTDLQDDAPLAEPHELALLNILSGDTSQGELLLDQALRLSRIRNNGAVAQRARDLIRQKLDPLVSFRERKPRPDDIDTELRNATEALSPKFQELAATEVPAALYLYADKLRKERREAESLKLFEKAAALDHAPSMLQAGFVLSNAADKKTSMPGAVQWFKMADAKGYAQATFALGECYLDGSGVPRDYDLALELLNRAASKDIAEAHYLLGGTYLGLGRPKAPGTDDEFDPAKLNPTVTGDERLKKARGHLEKAWKRDEPAAGPLLARLLITGQGGPADILQGIAILDAATKVASPDVTDLRILAYLLTTEPVENLPTPQERSAAGVKPEPKRAEQLMRQAAKLGDQDARDWCAEKRITY